MTLPDDRLSPARGGEGWGEGAVMTPHEESAHAPSSHAEGRAGRRLNAWLDGLPRTRLGRLSREVPAFRTCGIVGFHLALVTLFAGGLLTGRSLLVLALLALVCGLSFFAYAHLRRALVGRELIVLLEHVWFAQLCVASALWGLGEPLPPYLDLIAPPLAFFLACGRVGCLLCGCCHGNPSSLGIVYPESHVADGFARHLVGVRLFPVALVECAGLVLIGVTGFVALPFAAPGRVFLWLLIGYAVLRFGLEGLRGDARPHALGLSQARFMSLAEFALALALAERWNGRVFGAREAALGLLLAALLVGCLALRHFLDPRRKLLTPEHLREVRELVARGSSADAGRLEPLRSSQGVVLAVCRDAGGERSLSLSWRVERVDLALLCDLAVAALPDVVPASGRLIAGQALFVRAAGPGFAPPADPCGTLAAALRGYVARAAQSPTASPQPPAAVRPPGRPPRPGARQSYFGHAGANARP